MLFIVFMFIKLLFAEDYTSKAELLISSAPPSLKIMAQDLYQQVRSKNSQAGEVVTKDEYQTIVDILQVSASEQGVGEGNLSGAIDKDLQKKHIKELGEILLKYPNKDDKSRAGRCLEFSKLLHKQMLGNDLMQINLVGKSQVLKVATSFNLPSFDGWSEDAYGIVSVLFQSCIFLPTATYPMGMLQFKGEVQRFLTLVQVNQKIEDNKFMTITKRMSFIGGRPIPTAGKNLVLIPNEKITSTGDFAVFPIFAGVDSYKMLDGFDKRISTVMDLGIEKTSAVMCRFAEYAKTMKKRYGNRFKCGYKINSSEFESTDSVSFLCYEANDLSEGGRVKGTPFYIRDYDWPYCK